MAENMEQAESRLIEKLRQERAMLIQFEKLERERTAEAMTNIDEKADAVIRLFAAYRRPA